MFHFDVDKAGAIRKGITRLDRAKTYCLMLYRLQVIH
jgi:hypothetical protein